MSGKNIVNHETSIKEERYILWLKVNGELKAYIQSKVKDGAVTNDLLQDVFIKWYLNHQSIQNSKKAKAWLYTVAKNQVNDYYRALKKLAFQKLDVMDIETSLQVKPERLACLVMFINQLPEKYQSALLLSDLKNVKLKTIAELANISLSGAKSRVQRARLLLKTLIQKCCRIEADKYGNIVSVRPINCSSC